MSKEELRDVLNRNIDFIKQADTKAAYISTILFVIVGYLLSKSSIFIDQRWSLYAYIGLFFIGAITALFIIKSIYPKVTHIATQKSSIYFGSISSQTLTSYKKRLKQATQESTRNELIEQVYATSCIVTEKMKMVKVAFWLIVIFSGLAAITCLFARTY